MISFKHARPKQLLLLMLSALMLHGPIEAHAPQASNPNERQVLRLINAARSRGSNCRGGGGGHSLPGLKFNPVLQQSARTHARNMARHNFISHFFHGIGPRTRVAQNGYRSRRISEIIYKFSTRPSASAALRWWLSSPIHCRAIMNPHYQELGAAYGGQGTWVVELAQPQ